MLFLLCRYYADGFELSMRPVSHPGARLFTMAQRDFELGGIERIIVAHGDILEHNSKQVFETLCANTKS